MLVLQNPSLVYTKDMIPCDLVSEACSIYVLVQYMSTESLSALEFVEMNTLQQFSQTYRN